MVMNRKRLCHLARVHNQAVEEWEERICDGENNPGDFLSRTVARIQSALYCENDLEEENGHFWLQQISCNTLIVNIL